MKPGCLNILYNLFNRVLVVNMICVRGNMGNIQIKGTYRRRLQQVIMRLQNCTIYYFCKSLVCVRGEGGVDVKF